MSEQVQLRRGTAAQTATFTGAQGEVTVITDNYTLTVHDGITAGGHEVASKSYVDSVSVADLTSANVTTALGYTPLNSATFTGANVVVQLGYTPYDATINANAFTTLSAVANVGYLTAITSGNITTALGYTPYDANVNANAYTTLSAVSGVGYLTAITSGNVTTALGYTPLDAASFTGANIVSNIGATQVQSANIAAYLGGLIATDYTLKTDVIAEANNSAYLGGIPAASYATTASQVTVYNAGADQIIYTGNVQLNGTTPVIVSLPAPYSNAYYRVQVTHNGPLISTPGLIAANVISSSQFTVESVAGSDTNNVFWTTFGSVTA